MARSLNRPLAMFSGFFDRVTQVFSQILRFGFQPVFGGSSLALPQIEELLGQLDHPRAELGDFFLERLDIL
jgi:hypothetical protein